MKNVIIYIVVFVYTSVFSQVQLGLNWKFFGDSETDGRATDAPSVKSPSIAFTTIWKATFPDSIPQMKTYGVSGRNLSGTVDAYNGVDDIKSATWVHFQESGNQDMDEQRTKQEYATTFELFVRKIKLESPNSSISTETAYSFQREAENYRNWSSYNVAMREIVAKLATEGITLFVADVDKVITALVKVIGFEETITDDGGHYKGIGNLMIALSMYNTLGYNVDKLNLTTIPDSEVSTDRKNICKKIIRELYPVKNTLIKKNNFCTPDLFYVSYDLNSSKMLIKFSNTINVNDKIKITVCDYSGRLIAKLVVTNNNYIENTIALPCKNVGTSCVSINVGERMYSKRIMSFNN